MLHFIIRHFTSFFSYCQCFPPGSQGLWTQKYVLSTNHTCPANSSTLGQCKLAQRVCTCVPDSINLGVPCQCNLDTTAKPPASCTDACCTSDVMVFITYKNTIKIIIIKTTKLLYYLLNFRPLRYPSIHVFVGLMFCFRAASL